MKIESSDWEIRINGGEDKIHGYDDGESMVFKNQERYEDEVAQRVDETTLYQNVEQGIF